MTLGLFISGKLASPVSLGLLIINCESLDAAESAVELVKPLTKYLRLKNKTVSAQNVELILEYKTKDDKALEKALAADPGIRRFTFMNYDRETRI